LGDDTEAVIEEVSKAASASLDKLHFAMQASSAAARLDDVGVVLGLVDLVVRAGPILEAGQRGNDLHSGVGRRGGRRGTPVRSIDYSPSILRHFIASSAMAKARERMDSVLPAPSWAMMPPRAAAR